MSSFTERTNPWYSIYVPASVSNAPAIQGYFRIGSPDATTEGAFQSTLATDYADVAAQPAVQAAFGSSPSAGIVLYTAGDYVQFINGRSDTRVLNDSYVVHVLDKQDVDDGSAQTYRTYLRLGKPNTDIEAPFKGLAAPDQVTAFAKALAPSGAVKMTTTQATTDGSGVLSGDTTAGSSLVTAAGLGDTNAIDELETLRTSTDSRATGTAYAGSASVNGWALAQLRGIHLTLANKQRDAVAVAATSATAESLLTTQAQAGDPVVRDKLVELSAAPYIADVQSWATGVLATLAPSAEPQWTLGNGVALYSDQPITITSADTLAVTVGSDSRTVLGPSYNVTYDVSDSVINQIKTGAITEIGQITDKNLVTASLVKRASVGSTWRTVTMDRSKALSFTATDGGSFALSSQYAFQFGMNFTNGIALGYTLNVGSGASATISPFQVDMSLTGMETHTPSETYTYQKQAQTTADQIVLSAREYKGTVGTLQETLGKVAMAAAGVVNAAIFVYTTVVVASDSPHDALDTAEQWYEAIVGINATLLTASLILGVVHAVEAKVEAAKVASSDPTITLNTAGITLQVGTTTLNITTAGIELNATEIKLNTPQASVTPVPLPAVLSAANIEKLLNLLTPPPPPPPPPP